MKINEGQIVLKVDGVINLEEIKSNLSLNLEKYKNIIWTKETRKDIQELIAELKPERTKIKKIAAAFNKAGKEIIRTKYEEIKEVEALLDEVINPLEQGEKDYLEKVRLENIEKKKAIFQDQISEINEVINQLNNEFNYELHQEVIFIDDWGKKSENSIKEELEKIVDLVGETRCKLLDKIKGVENTCKLKKLEYDLGSDLDYKLILKDDIYIKELSELENVIDDFAANQQSIEYAAEEKARLEAERKAKIEAEKLLSEQKAKDEAAEKEKQRAIKEAQEKAKKEERERIEKLELEEKAKLEKASELLTEAKENIAEKFLKDTYFFHPESDCYFSCKKGEKIPYDSMDFELSCEVSKEEYEQGIEIEKQTKLKLEKEMAKKPGSVKTREYNLKFTVNVDQAKKLFECLNENNIKFEYINA